MHSALNRVQSVFGYFTTVAFVLGLLTSVSVVLYPADPATSVELSNVHVIKGRPHHYANKREEYAQIRFDLDADLSPLFNWNTKQLFVYVLATYPSEISQQSSSSNPNGANFTESVIWDTIIAAPVSPYSFSSLKSAYVDPYLSSFTKSKRSGSKPIKKAKDTSTKKGMPGILKLQNQKPKYQVTDITGRIAERSGVNLALGWNVQPWIGALQWSPGTNIENNVGLFGLGPITGGKGGRSKTFDFPALKGSKPEGSGTAS